MLIQNWLRTGEVIVSTSSGSYTYHGLAEREYWQLKAILSNGGEGMALQYLKRFSRVDLHTVIQADR